MTLQVNKPLEHTFEFGLALTATLLQINLQGFDFQAISLKLAVFTGSVSYVFKAMRDEKMSNKDAIFSALTGYTFGVYLSPAIVDYYSIVKFESSAGVHYLCGAFGQWILNVGWGILKDAHKDGWNAIREKYFSSKRGKNDDNDYQS